MGKNQGEGFSIAHGWKVRGRGAERPQTKTCKGERPSRASVALVDQGSRDRCATRLLQCGRGDYVSAAVYPLLCGNDYLS